MNEPIQLLYLGPSPPDLGTSAFGPFVVRAVEGLDQFDVALAEASFDAVVAEFDAPNALYALALWPGLSRAVLDAAFVAIAPQPQAADTLRLLRLGVQDVIPRRESDALCIARVARLAVERKRVERAARRAYATDLATGLPNHAQLMEHMTHLLALREREPAAMAVLAVRLDGLAGIEARLGAEAANVLRRKAAVRLRSGLRASDVVAAVGTDSFVVLLAWIDDQAAAEGVSAKLVLSLQRPFNVAGQALMLGVSVGAALYPTHGKAGDVLLRRALAQASGMVAVGGAGSAAEVARRTRHGPAAANDEE